MHRFMHLHISFLVNILCQFLDIFHKVPIANTWFEDILIALSKGLQILAMLGNYICTLCTLHEV